MLRLTKKADYGLIAVKHLAESGNGHAYSAKDIAEAYHIPAELLAKILQKLAKAGLLTSLHGTNGGYVLARDPHTISAFEVIKAIDGPLFITACSSTHKTCGQSSTCNVKEPLRKVNDSIREVLSSIMIADMREEVNPTSDEVSPERVKELVRLSV